MRILGIADGQTSGAAVLENGRLLAAINEERIVRIKMARGFPRDAIREVLGGGAPMSPPIARMVVQSFQQSPTTVAEELQLSPRELEVLDGLAKGLPYKQIADQLDISLGTIRTHIEHIYRKLHVHNRTDAVVKYLRGS